MSSAIDYNSMKNPELKQLAKERGFTGYSGMNKQQLIGLLRGYHTGGKTSKRGSPRGGSPRGSPRGGPTVKQLREQAKAKGLTNYSGLVKQELIDLLAGKPVIRKSPKKAGARAPRRVASPRGGPTVKELIAQLKARNIGGYSGLRKQDLIDLLAGKVVTRKSPSTRGSTAGAGAGAGTARRSTARAPRTSASGVVDYNTYTVPELRTQSRLFGLTHSGKNKAELVAQLNAYKK